MGAVIAFPKKRKTVEWQRLMKEERDAILTCLLRNGLATYLSFHNGGQYACVYDAAGDAHWLGREEGSYAVFDPDENLIAESPEFKVVLTALEMSLERSPGVPA